MNLIGPHAQCGLVVILQVQYHAWLILSSAIGLG